MIVTSDRRFAERAKRLRHHGMAISDLKRHSSKKIIHEAYSEIGYNLRMSDLEAAVGIEQLKKFPETSDKRRKLAKKYDQAFKKSEFIETPFVPKGYVHNYQTYIIRLKKNKLITRDALMQKLLDAGIATRKGVMASHLEPPYVKMSGRVSLPETEKAAAETMAIPLYAQMTSKEQNYVIQHILKFTR